MGTGADQFRLRLQIQAVEKGMAAATAGIRGHLRALQGEVKRFNAQTQRMRAVAGEFSAYGRTMMAPFTVWFRMLRGLIGLLTGLLSIGVGVFQALAGVISSVTGAVFRLASAIGTALWGAAQRVFTGMLSIAQSVFGYLRTAAVVAVGALTASLVLLAKQGVQVNQALVSIEQGLKIMLGGAGAAKRLLRDLRQEARSSAFEFVDLADMTKRLLAFGFREREVLPMIRTLGDVAAGLGGGKELLDRLILAFGQIRAKGKLMGQEAMQLTEAGIAVRELLQVPVGKDVGEMAMPAAQALPKLLEGMQRRFGGLQQQLAQTLVGRISNIRDEVNELSSAISQGLFRSLTSAAGIVLKFLQNLQQTAAGRVVIKHLTSLFDNVGRAIERAAQALPGITEKLAEFLEGGRWENFKRATLDVLLGVWDRLLAIGEWLATNWPTLWQRATAFAETALGVLLGVIVAVRNQFQGTGLTIRDVFEAALNYVREFAGGAVKALADVAGWVARLGAQIVPVIGTLVAGFQQLTGDRRGARQTREWTVETTRGLREFGIRAPGWGMEARQTIRRELDPERLFGARRVAEREDWLGQMARDIQQTVRGVRERGILPTILPGIEDPKEMARRREGAARALFWPRGEPAVPAGPTVQQRAAAWQQAYPGEPFPPAWAREAEAAGIRGPALPAPVPVAQRPLESRGAVEVHVDVNLQGLPEGVRAEVEDVVAEWTYRAVGVPA